MAHAAKFDNKYQQKIDEYAKVFLKCKTIDIYNMPRNFIKAICDKIFSDKEKKWNNVSFIITKESRYSNIKFCEYKELIVKLIKKYGLSYKMNGSDRIIVDNLALKKSVMPLRFLSTKELNNNGKENSEQLSKVLSILNILAKDENSKEANEITTKMLTNLLIDIHHKPAKDLTASKLLELYDKLKQKRDSNDNLLIDHRCFHIYLVVLCATRLAGINNAETAIDLVMQRMKIGGDISVTTFSDLFAIIAKNPQAVTLDKVKKLYSQIESSFVTKNIKDRLSYIRKAFLACAVKFSGGEEYRQELNENIKALLNSDKIDLHDLPHIFIEMTFTEIIKEINNRIQKISFVISKGSGANENNNRSLLVQELLKKNNLSYNICKNSEATETIITNITNLNLNKEIDNERDKERVEFNCRSDLQSLLKKEENYKFMDLSNKSFNFIMQVFDAMLDGKQGKINQWEGVRFILNKNEYPYLGDPNFCKLAGIVFEKNSLDLVSFGIAVAMKCYSNICSTNNEDKRRKLFSQAVYYLKKIAHLSSPKVQDFINNQLDCWQHGLFKHNTSNATRQAYQLGNVLGKLSIFERNLPKDKIMTNKKNYECVF